MAPKILVKFEGKREIDGKKRTYWIQTFTNEYEEEVIHYMITGFLNDEPITKRISNYQTNSQIFVRINKVIFYRTG